MLATVQCNAAFVAGAVRPRSQRRTVCAVQQQDVLPAAAPLRSFLAAGLAAAAVAGCCPAEAKVVLVQPDVKNFTKEAPKAAASSGGGAKQASAPKRQQEEASSPGGDFDGFRPLVLPLTIVALAAAGAAAAKSDPEFAELMDATWSAKDSNSVGAGYETAPGLKDSPFYGGTAVVAAKPKAAPKAAKAAKKGGGGGGINLSFFSKK